MRHLEEGDRAGACGRQCSAEQQSVSRLTGNVLQILRDVLSKEIFCGALQEGIIGQQRRSIVRPRSQRRDASRILPSILLTFQVLTIDLQRQKTMRARVSLGETLAVGTATWSPLPSVLSFFIPAAKQVGWFNNQVIFS